MKSQLLRNLEWGLAHHKDELAGTPEEEAMRDFYRQDKKAFLQMYRLEKVKYTDRESEKYRQKALKRKAREKAALEAAAPREEIPPDGGSQKALEVLESWLKAYGEKDHA